MPLLIEYLLITLGSVLAGASIAWAVLELRCRVAVRPDAGAATETKPADDVRHAILRAVPEHASEVIIGLDTRQQPVFVSPACREMLGCEPVDLLGDAGEYGGGTCTDLRNALRAADPVQVDGAIWPVRHTDGTLVRCAVRFRPTGDSQGWIAVLRDVTAQCQAEEKLAEARGRLARLSMQDSLTGLPNRACFMETAERILTGAEPIAVLIIDLDRFRAVNDVHGHAVGDSMLRTVTARLARELTGEPILARLGADEFAALLHMTEDDSEIAARARDILRVIAEPIPVGEMTLDVSAAIGIAVSPRDGAEAASVLRAADLAVTHAKQAGGGCYRFFEPAMGEELALASELRGQLRSAIQAGEIVPYFQPLVRLADADIVGFEVLARWEHPQRGRLPPARFLPLLEECGLASAMFASLLSQACAAAARWPEQVTLAVNISPHELQDELLPDDVRRILDANGMDGGRLEIEITENALIHDSRVARGVLDGLRTLGVAIVLDDFGTGFSSLYRLRELPFDKVKIDKSFMRALDTDAESARTVAAVLGLGHALGLALTAEGIEDAAAMQHLRKLGCTYGQGFLFGRPMPAAEATALLRAGLSVRQQSDRAVSRRRSAALSASVRQD